MKNYNREIFKLAIPALATLAADPLVSIVDTIFVGRLGAMPLGALGINSSVFAFAFIAFNFLAYGTTPMISRAVGSGDQLSAAKTAVQAVFLAAIIGVFMTVFLELAADPILDIMGASNGLHIASKQYLQIRALAGPAFLIITAGHGVLRGYGDTKTPLFLSIGFNLINLTLDPLFIFTFGWGIRGAAWATVAAQWSGAAAFLIFIFIKRNRKYAIRITIPRFREFLPLFRVGRDLGIRTLTLVGAMTLATGAAARIGVSAVAGHQIITQLRMFSALAIDCLAIAAQALIARYRGMRDFRAVREITRRLLFWGCIAGIGFALIYAVFRPGLILLFTQDREVAGAASSVFLFLVFLQPLDAFVFVLDGVLMGAEDFRYLAVSMVISSAIACAVMVTALLSGWGLAGIWWGLAVLMVIRGLTLWYRSRIKAETRDLR